MLYINRIQNLKTENYEDYRFLVIQPIREQGGLIRNNFAKFGVDPDSSSWEEVENMSINHRPGLSYWISDPLKK